MEGDCWLSIVAPRLKRQIRKEVEKLAVIISGASPIPRYLGQVVGNSMSPKGALKLCFLRGRELSRQATGTPAVSLHLRVSLRGTINVVIAICSRAKSAVSYLSTGQGDRTPEQREPWGQVGAVLSSLWEVLAAERKDCAYAVEFTNCGWSLNSSLKIRDPNVRCYPT